MPALRFTSKGGPTHTGVAATAISSAPACLSVLRLDSCCCELVTGLASSCDRPVAAASPGEAVLNMLLHVGRPALSSRGEAGEPRASRRSTDTNITE
jgi:hypothetical protein